MLKHNSNKVETLQVFNYGENKNAPVRVQVINNQTWFVAKDVCSNLGIEHHRDALTRLDDDERGSVLLDTLGGIQQMSAVNESGLYSLVFQSRKPGAKKFRKWVTMEVLPSIRKTGGYSVRPSRPRRLQPKDRDEVLKAFFAELPQWVTLEDEREVAEFFGVSRHHVHEVLMGRRTGYAVLAALTSHGSENRKRGIRRPDLSPEATARKTLQLALEFANETKEG